MKLWAHSFGWQDHLHKRDLEAARDVASRTLSGEVTRLGRSIQIVHLAMVQLAKAIAEGDVRMTLSGLDKLTRLEAFLSDEPESRHELVMLELGHKSDAELRELVKAEVATLSTIDASRRSE